MAKERRQTDELILNATLENGKLLASVQQQVTDLSGTVSKLETTLLGGNGKAGEIPTIWSQHSVLKDRVVRVEKKWVWIAGVGSAFALLAAVAEFAYHTNFLWRH